MLDGGDLDIRLLGEVRLGAGGRWLPLRRLECATLAVLALDPGHVVPVERFVDALWERPPASVRNRVQTMVSRIRAALVDAGGPAETISTHPAGYRLGCPADRIDLHRLLDAAHRGRAAAEVGDLDGAASGYRLALREVAGQPLAGMPGTFFETEVVRLRDLVTRTWEELIDVELARGHGAQVIPELTRLVREFPARERVRAQLMAALHRSGRTAEALGVYREAHAYLTNEFGVGPGAELREQHQLVLAGDTSPEPVRPRQLPPLNKDFTGRAKAVTEIVDTLFDRGGVVAVSGIGGVGKTALMVAAAHQLAPRYPDACLYLDLRGAEADPVAPMAALGMCLRGLGVTPAAIGDDLDARIGLFRSFTASRRILVLLDNAADERQVAPLLPTGASAAVVTSRRVLLALDGAHQLPLSALSPDEGVALLARIVGGPRVTAEPAAARQVVDLCGGLPLAIRLVGARLALHRRWTLAELGRRLADEQHRLDELEFGDQTVRGSLHLSYRGLNDEARRLFRLLGFLPTAGFGDWAPAALLGATTARTAERAFEELLRGGLVALHTGEPARYGMHDLVAVFARERAAAESGAERASALGRWLEALTRLTEQARQRLPTGGVPPYPAPPGCWRVPDETARRVGDHAIPWFEAERVTVRLAVGQAADLGRPELAWRLAVSVAGFLELRHYVDDWAAVNDRATAAVREQPDSADMRLGSAALTLDAADLCGELGRPAEALALFRSARLSFRRSGLGEYAANAAAGLGKTARTLGRVREARAAFGWATRVSAGSGTFEEGITLLRLGNLLIDHGTPASVDNAVAAFAHARDVFTGIGDLRDAANAHTCLAIAHRRLGLVDEGIAHARRAVTGYQSTSDTVHEAFSEQTLAQLYLDAGRLDEAEACLTRSSRVVRDSGSAVGEARGHVAWGRLALLRDDAPEACAAFESALRKYADAGLDNPKTLFMLAQARLRAGDRHTAVRTAREAYAMFVERDSSLAGVVAEWLGRSVAGDTSSGPPVDPDRVVA